MFSRNLKKLLFLGLGVAVIGIALLLFGITAEQMTLSVIGFVLLLFAIIELPGVFGFWIVSMIAEKIMTKTGNQSKVVYFIGVPILIIILCNLIAAVIMYGSSAYSIMKYDANISSFSEDYAYPGHDVLTELGDYRASVKQTTQQKEDHAFSIRIDSELFDSTYTDLVTYHTNWLEEGMVEWESFGKDSLLIVSAVEGKYAYALGSEGWERFNLKAKTQAECATTKQVLSQYKSTYMNGAILVICPE